MFCIKDFGFIILCPEPYISEIKFSFNTTKFLNENVRVVIGSNFSKDDIVKVSKICDKLDITEKNLSKMINFGVSRSLFDWNFILYAGAKPTKYLIEKYLYFCKSENDVLYPVVNRRMYFPEASTNGLFFNRKSIPKFQEFENFNESKLTWASDLLDKKINLKGIIGANFT